MTTQPKGHREDMPQKADFRVRLVTGTILTFCIVASFVAWRLGTIGAYEAPTLVNTVMICTPIDLVAFILYAGACGKRPWLVYLGLIAMSIPLDACVLG
jgi:accessory gene regulator protein AgrB